MSATNRGAVREERDFYPTPREAFVPLIPHLPKGVEIWEPACGDVRLISWMRERGLDAAGGDLALGYDFLQDETPRVCIVTNPPYSLGIRFVEHAVAMTYGACAAHECFLLLRLNFLGAEKRRDWFLRNEPGALFVLSERPSFVASLKCKTCSRQWTQPIEAERPKKCPHCGGERPKVTTSDATEYAWFYWGPRHRGIFHM